MPLKRLIITLKLFFGGCNHCSHKSLCLLTSRGCLTCLTLYGIGLGLVGLPTSRQRSFIKWCAFQKKEKKCAVLQESVMVVKFIGLFPFWKFILYIYIYIAIDISGGLSLKSKCSIPWRDSIIENSKEQTFWNSITEFHPHMGSSGKTTSYYT